MKKITILLILILIFINSFSQTNTITVDKLIDFEIGMTYDKVIEKHPNTTIKEKSDIYYESLVLSNGMTVTGLLLSFYNNKLYDIGVDFNNQLHLGLKNKYGYTEVDGMTFNGYYGTSYKSNISAVYIENRIWIVDNNIRKIASTEGF